jgi:hypothetical protein
MRRTKADDATAVKDLRVKFAFEILARKEEDETLISTTAEVTMMPNRFSS